MKRFWAALLLAACLLSQVGAQAEGAGIVAYARVEEFSGFIEEDAYPVLVGEIRCSAPIERVKAVLYDLRQLEVIDRYTWTPEEGEVVRRLSLDVVRKALLGWVSAGEKRLTITVEANGRSRVVFEREFYRAGDCFAPRNLGSVCTYSCSEQRGRIWTDNKGREGWLPMLDDDILTVTLTKSKRVAGLQVWWSAVPEKAVFTFFDANGEKLGKVKRGPTVFTPLVDWIEVPQGTRSFTLSVKGCKVEELLVIEKGRVPSMIQMWQETADKWDMMVVSTHQDDEQIFFGATIPTCVAQGREVGVVYMVDCGDERYKEALSGLWSEGVVHYPEFLGLRNGMPEEETYSKWGGEENYVGLLVEQIRKHRPEVVLTHDFKGEYGHKQHITTAYAIVKAVKAAADPEQYPESAEKYGVWQAKKLYIHLWRERVLDMDWDEPIEGFGGMTGYEISRRAYDKHRTQQRFVPYSMGIASDNSLFGLYFTTVGRDRKGGDFFEHID